MSETNGLRSVKSPLIGIDNLLYSSTLGSFFESSNKMVTQYISGGEKAALKDQGTNRSTTVMPPLPIHY